MTHKARIRSGYRARPLLIALLLLAYGLWAVYDGFYHYPSDNEKYREFVEFKEARDIESVSEAPTREWEAYAEKHNLPLDYNEIPSMQHSSSDMMLQYVLMGICLPLGLLALGAAIRCGWLWIGTDEKGLHTSTGQFAPWSQINSIDKSRWHHKGIAVVHYTDQQGNARRITLDDWKYDTEPTRQMLRQVEEQLGEPHADDEPPAEGASAAPAAAGSALGDGGDGGDGGL